MTKLQDLVRTKKMIATFMKGSTPLEVYLQQGGELTDSDLKTLEVTISMLVTFLDVWKRKHTTVKLSSGTPLIGPSVRESSRKPRVPKRK